MKKNSQFKTFFIFCIFSLTLVACGGDPTSSSNNNQNPRDIQGAFGTPVLDGSASDEAWENATWYPMTYSWMPNAPDSTDFKGRYKVLWDNNMLYVLAEITDDTLVDTHSDGLVKCTDDDCLTIFLDEDASGGEHGYNYNAFAYNIALDSKVVDIAPDSSIRYYDDHCISRRTTVGNISVWEIGIKVFDGKNYTDGGDNIPKTLQQGKKMGLAIAYCDNDYPPEYEHVMGNIPIEGGDKNKAWRDASVFGLLELK